MYYHPFDFPPEVDEAFTYGDCWRLAKAIHDISGYPIYAVGCAHTGPSESNRDWSHMFVQLPNGNLLDIRGIWDEENMLGEWAFEYVDCHPEDGPYYCLDSWLVEDWEEATHHQSPTYPEVDPAFYAREVLDELDYALVTC